MKQGLISALVAAVVSIGAWQAMNLARGDGPTEVAATADTPAVLRYTDELVEDGWVARARVPTKNRSRVRRRGRLDDLAAARRSVSGGV